MEAVQSRSRHKSSVYSSLPTNLASLFFAFLAGFGSFAILGALLAGAFFVVISFFVILFNDFDIFF